MTEKQNRKAWIKGKWSGLKSLRYGPWPAEEEHDKKRRLWAMGWLLLAVLLVEEISLVWTAGKYTGLTGGIWCAPLVLLLNLLPLLLLAGLLYALIGRASVSLGVSGGLILLISLVNTFKLRYRGDPFRFSDLFLAGEAGEMMESYSLVFSAGQIIGILLAILLVALLVFFTGKLPLRGHWKARGITAGGCAAALVLLALLVYPNQELYRSIYAGGDSVSKRDAAQWYAAHGLTYSFLHTVIDEDLLGGAAETVEAMGESDYVEPDDQANVNIIAVQLEAYCDLSDYLDAPAVEEVYEPLHAIEAEAISGNLITNTNGGGTINTERSFITGYTSLPEFGEETNSYAWYLQSIGYTVEGSHPNGETFYDRNTINANLGFQNYYFEENLYGELLGDVEPTRDSDALLFDEIVDLMEEADGPYFSFSVSFQNHGPYSTSYTEKEYLTRADCPNRITRSITNHYLSLVETTNQVLADTVERLESLDEPVLLVAFGDHKPYLGDYTDLDYYANLGMNCDPTTDEGFYNYYSTPYFIWANSAAKAELGTDCVGDGGDFGPYFLMKKVFDLCGWTGDAMMQAANKLLEAGVTVVSSAVEVYCENGQLVDELSEEGQEALDTFLSFQKAWQKDFIYGDLAEQNQQAREEAAAEAAAAEESQSGETAQAGEETTAGVEPSESPSPAGNRSGGSSSSSRSYSGGGSTGGSAVPADSAAPAATESPADTQAPADTESPADTQVPADTESPVDSEAPATPESPAAPEPTTPAESTAPSAEPAPSDGGDTGGSTGSETTGGGDSGTGTESSSSGSAAEENAAVESVESVESAPEAASTENG